MQTQTYDSIWVPSTHALDLITQMLFNIYAAAGKCCQHWAKLLHAMPSAVVVVTLIVVVRFVRASLCRWSKPQTNCIIISFGWHFNLISFAQQLSSSLRFFFFVFFCFIRLSLSFVCTFPPIAHIFAPFTEFFPPFAHFRLRIQLHLRCRSVFHLVRCRRRLQCNHLFLCLAI